VCGVPAAGQDDHVRVGYQEIHSQSLSGTLCECRHAQID
jgi:hypothetical protein